MRKLIMAFTFLMIMVLSANAQNNIRQIALNKFKSTLIAPSQFILTDYFGNKISLNKIPVYWHNKYIEIDTIFIGDKPLYGSATVDAGRAEMSAHKILGDSIKILEKIDTLITTIKITAKEYSPVYSVTITGDARNRMGGYEQMSEVIYVDKNNITYLTRPYKEKATCVRTGKTIVKYTYFYFLRRQKFNEYVLKFKTNAAPKFEDKLIYGGIVGLEKIYLNNSD